MPTTNVQNNQATQAQNLNLNVNVEQANNATPTHLAVPSAADQQKLEAYLKELNDAFEAFEQTYSKLYEEYKAGKISKEDLQKGVAAAAEHFSDVEGQIVSNPEFKQLVASYPSLGNYQGSGAGLVHDLESLAQAVVFANGSVSPKDLQNLWDSITDAEHTFEQSGVYNPVVQS